VERLGHPVRLVPGAPENLKITTPADLALAEHVLKCRENDQIPMTKSQRGPQP
jgi:2-C-methyl-D-erythritol 4-phosphate cytidylyltransferase